MDSMLENQKDMWFQHTSGKKEVFCVAHPSNVIDGQRTNSQRQVPTTYVLDLLLHCGKSMYIYISFTNTLRAKN